MYGEANRRWVILTKSVCTDFSWLQIPDHGDKIFLPSWYRESIFHIGVLSPVFRKKKRNQRVPFVSPIFQVPLAQNILMSKWHTLGWHVLPPLICVCSSQALFQREISKKDTRIIKTFSGWILYTSIGKYSAGSGGKKMSKIVCFILFLSQEL